MDNSYPQDTLKGTGTILIHFSVHEGVFFQVIETQNLASELQAWLGLCYKPICESWLPLA